MIGLVHFQATEQPNCIPGCAKMVLGKIGIEESEKKLADILGTEERGTHWWGLPVLEKYFPVQVRIGKASEERLGNCLSQGVPPLMAVRARVNGRNEPHVIVVVGLDDEKIYFHDPAQPDGPTVIDRNVMIENWMASGRLMAMIVPGEPGQRVRPEPPECAFIYDTNGNPQDVYSLAPERQTNFGKVVKVDGILLSGNTVADAQAEANTLAGLYRAWKNIRFPFVKVPAFNNRCLEPATLDYFAITLAASDTVRGLEWNQKEFLCTGVTYHVDHENGIISVDVMGEASTWGPPGEGGPSGEYPDDVPPPEDPPNEPGEYWPSVAATEGDPPPWWPDCPYSDVDWEAAFIDFNGFHVTNDIEAAVPVWNILLASNFLRDFDIRVSDNNETVIWACCEVVASVYRSTTGGAAWSNWNLPDPVNTAGDIPAPTWASGDLSTVAIVIDPTSFHRVFAVVRDYTHRRLWFYRTLNALSANPVWASQEISTTMGGWNNWFGCDLVSGHCGLHVSSDGDVWVWVRSFSPSRFYLFHSTDHGASYTEIDVLGVNAISVSHGDSVRTLRDAPTIVLLGGMWEDSAHNKYYLFRSLDRGTTWTDLSAALPNGTMALRCDPLDSDRAIVYVAGVMYHSQNKGYSWDSLSAWPHAITDMDLHPFDPNKIITPQYGGAEVITYSNDGGKTTRTVANPVSQCYRAAFARKWW